MDSELVNFHVKGILSGEPFTVSKSWAALGEVFFSGLQGHKCQSIGDTEKRKISLIQLTGPVMNGCQIIKNSVSENTVGTECFPICLRYR